MKLTFEGNTYSDILDQMRDVLGSKHVMPGPITKEPRASTNGVQGPGPEPTVLGVQAGSEPVDKLEPPVEKPVDKMAKVRAAKGKKKEAEGTAEDPQPNPLGEPDKPAPSPAELVAIRQKTIDELQAAYANGKQAEVFALLSTHGNGAKSFRELPPEAFIPIREAIDLGALT